MEAETLKCVYVAEHLRIKGYVKVGKTTDIKSRLSVLNTSVPEDFTVALIYKTDMYDELEELVIKKLKSEDLQRGTRDTKEFFECTAAHVKEVIDQVVEERTNLKGSYLTTENIQELLIRRR